MQHNVRGLGIEPEVEFVARVGGFDIVCLRIEAAAHNQDAFSQRRELRIDRDSQRNVCQRPGGVNRNLMRMRAHLTDEKVSRVFIEWLRGRQTLGHGWNFEGPVRLRFHSTGRRCHKPSPCAQPRDFAVERCLHACLLLVADQRKNSATNDGNIGVPGQLQHAQRVQRLFVAPRIAGHHGDSEHLHVWRLKQRKHCHLIGAAGTSAILIDQDQALLSGAHRDAGQKQKRKQLSFHNLNCGTALGSTFTVKPAGRCLDH